MRQSEEKEVLHLCKSKLLRWLSEQKHERSSWVIKEAENLIRNCHLGSRMSWLDCQSMRKEHSMEKLDANFVV